MTDELTQGVKDAQAKFDAGMGADGDASPYPMLNELRATAPVHHGWPEMGIFENPEEGQQIFSAYTFDAVKAVFTDNKTFSTRCYEAIVRPLQGPTILEMREPEHQVYRRLHEFAFARSSMRRWEAELVRPLVERTVERLRDAKRADLVEEVFMPIPVRVIAALIGLPESDIPEFHRLAIQLLGFQRTWTRRSRRPHSCVSTSSESSPTVGASPATTWSPSWPGPTSTASGCPMSRFMASCAICCLRAPRRLRGPRPVWLSGS
jgi:cytochrome P450